MGMTAACLQRNVAPLGKSVAPTGSRNLCAVATDFNQVDWKSYTA